MKSSALSYLILFVCTSVLSSCAYYDAYKKENVAQDGFVYVYSTKSKAQSLETFADSLFLDKAQFFKSLELLSDTNKWKAGKYKLVKGMTDKDLLNLLESGRKETVKITLTYGRIPENFIGRVCKKIEADSAKLMTMLNDEEYVASLGTNLQNVMTLFIPNTYEFYWDTDEDEFMQRMKKEHNKFWNEERLRKCDSLKLTPEQVYTLGSIVQSEQSKIKEEWPIIAGLYLNRLRIGMPLESDPTLLFPIRDFTAKRVYNYHKLIDSPYNTYKNLGLPPGPICMVQPGVIDAVLNPASHKYLFMCASEKLDGTHRFEVSLAAHNRNAALYRAAINRLKIR
ncbi:MAG TPA: endolytic transglycosylase MltG [Bacteroidia bacterium]